MCPFLNAFILEPLWDPCLIGYTSDLGRNPLETKLKPGFTAMVPAGGPCILHPPSKVDLDSTACPVVNVPKGSRCLAVTLEESMKLGAVVARAGDSSRLWKMEIPMALE